MTCNDYIAQHAIPLAQTVRHFLARDPYQQLEDLSWQLLSHWQDLPQVPADKTPASEQEGYSGTCCTACINGMNSRSSPTSGCACS